MEEIIKNTSEKKRIFTIANIYKAIAFILFCVYLSQLYISYAIDKRQVMSAGMTYFILFLRWTTIGMVGYAVIVPFFGGKYLKIQLAFLGPIVAMLNLIFLKQNFIAWGADKAVLWRRILFVVEQILLIVISSYDIYDVIKNKIYKNFKPLRYITIVLLMYATFTYQPIFKILFGEADAKTLDFNGWHIAFVMSNFVFLVAAYFTMRFKSPEEKKIFFACLSCSGVFNFFYAQYYGVSNLPLHLCNAAIVMMFVSYIFNNKGIFYFTYFVNVIGALFAMLMPNVKTDVFTNESMRFWYNHVYAFVLPILGVGLKVFERPNLKMIGKAIFWFTVYFVLVAFLNAWFENIKNGGTDYFFINSNFFFEKLNMKTGLKDNYVWIVNVPFNNYVLEFYPLFHFVVYIIYIGLMFGMWYIYDALYHIEDAHTALHLKKKVLKESNMELKEFLKINDLSEPLHKEKINMVEIQHFTKTYSGSKKPSVDDFSITIKDGEVYGFLGHNGAGKSTTIKSLVGIQSISQGKIIVEGYDIAKQPVEAKLKIGYVSDNHAVYENLTGREYINYIADLYMVSKEDRDSRIAKYTKMFSLEEAIDKEIKSYSHGMKQKIVIIASLIHNPKVWVLDEPLTGLDPTSCYQIKQCMREHANNGNIVFFSSHVIEVVEKICDKICIISHGKLKCEYYLSELKEKGISLEDLYLKYVSNANKEDEKAQ